MQKGYFEFLYRRVQKPEELPWAFGSPEVLLGRAMQARGALGRALDIGSGAGTWAVMMAKAGYQVTAVDFIPAALRFHADIPPPWGEGGGSRRLGAGLVLFLR